MSIERGTGNLERSDLFEIHNVIQNTLLSNPKDIIIALLRNFYSEDSIYHYVSDEWGFPKVVDHTDLAQDAGIADDLTTRVYIAEAFRAGVIYYPSILVKTGSVNSVPISFNRNKETVRNTVMRVVDGYGNERIFVTPSHFIFTGAWEGQINIEVSARGIRERDDLVRLSMLFFTDIRFEEFRKAGILMKRISAGAPSEGEDGNEKLYKQTINLDIRTEWRREIPVENTVDSINICVDFGRLDTTPEQISPNITINTSVDLIDEIQNL